MSDAAEQEAQERREAEAEVAGSAEEEPTAEEPAEEEPAAEEPTPEPAAEPVHGAAADDTAACRPTARGVAGWPFLVYLAAWAALAAATAFILTAPGAAAVPIDDPNYPVLLLSGITLAALGPVLVLITWAVAFAGAERGCRGGLLTTALVRGASATLFGVIVWWGALLLVDALRLGLI